MCRQSGPARREAKQWIDIIEFCDRNYYGHRRGSRGPTLRTSKQPSLAAQRKPAQRPLGGVVGQAHPAILDKARKAVPAPEQIVNRLDHRSRARQTRTLGLQPLLQSLEKRRALLLPDPPTLLGAPAVDRALDLKQRIDTLDRLQRNRRDRRRLLVAPGIRHDISPLEERPPSGGPRLRASWRDTSVPTTTHKPGCSTRASDEKSDPMRSASQPSWSHAEAAGGAST